MNKDMHDNDYKKKYYLNLEKNESKMQHTFSTLKVYTNQHQQPEACVTLLATSKNAPYSYDTLIGYQFIKLSHY